MSDCARPSQKLKKLRNHLAHLQLSCRFAHFSPNTLSAGTCLHNAALWSPFYHYHSWSSTGLKHMILKLFEERRAVMLRTLGPPFRGLWRVHGGAWLPRRLEALRADARRRLGDNRRQEQKQNPCHGGRERHAMGVRLRGLMSRGLFKTYILWHMRVV